MSSRSTFKVLKREIKKTYASVSQEPERDLIFPTIWESREAFERFMEEKLGPALAEVMGGPPPGGGAPQYFPINVLVIPH